MKILPKIEIFTKNRNCYQKSKFGWKIRKYENIFSKGIDVGAGVIDQDYRGNVGIILFNFSDDDFQVEEGDRIAQFILERIFIPTLIESDEKNYGSKLF